MPTCNTRGLLNFVTVQALKKSIDNVRTIYSKATDPKKRTSGESMKTLTDRENDMVKRMGFLRDHVARKRAKSSAKVNIECMQGKRTKSYFSTVNDLFLKYLNLWLQE